MADSTLTRTGRGAPAHQQLTPTEQALLEGIRIDALRNAATAVWRIKVRLQFTGEFTRFSDLADSSRLPPIASYE